MRQVVAKNIVASGNTGAAEYREGVAVDIVRWGSVPVQIQFGYTAADRFRITNVRTGFWAEGDSEAVLLVDEEHRYRPADGRAVDVGQFQGLEPQLSWP